MKLKIRFDKYFQFIELNEKETEEMWISLSIEEEYDSQEEKEKLIQEKFNEEFNKPEFNNWRKHNRRLSMPKKPFRKDDQEVDETDHMDYFPDYSDEMAREKKEEYEHICEIIRKALKEKQAELLIAIVLDGVSVTEYAEREGVSVSAISHRLDTAKKNFKKIYPKSSTFPSCHG